MTHSSRSSGGSRLLMKPLFSSTWRVHWISKSLISLDFPNDLKSTFMVESCQVVMEESDRGSNLRLHNICLFPLFTWDHCLMFITIYTVRFLSLVCSHRMKFEVSFFHSEEIIIRVCRFVRLYDNFCNQKATKQSDNRWYITPFWDLAGWVYTTQ